MKFRLLRSFHQHGGKVYKPGDVFEVSKDIRWMNAPGQERFELMPDDTPVTGEVQVAAQTGFHAGSPAVTSTADDLEKKTLQELTILAEELDIPLTGVNTKRKDAVIEAIRKGMEG